MFLVGTINPLTESELFEKCEFIMGDVEEYEKDKARAKEKASFFIEQLKEISETILGLRNGRRT